MKKKRIEEEIKELKAKISNMEELIVAVLQNSSAYTSELSASFSERLTNLKHDFETLNGEVHRHDSEFYNINQRIERRESYDQKTAH